MFRHILHTKQFSRDDLDQYIFPLTNIIAELDQTTNGKLKLLKVLQTNKITLYFSEVSTRTALSFWSAGISLGAKVMAPHDPDQYSSIVKGESFEDTIRTISCYCDLIVIRHKNVGQPMIAAQEDVSSVPIINAGDGDNQHPTQALLDLYTIYKHRGSIDGVKVALVGDLQKSRTINSLCYLLAKYDKPEIYLVAPEVARIKPEMLEHLEQHNIKYTETQDFAGVLKEVDYVYMTRIQEERYKQDGHFINQAHEDAYNEAKGQFILNNKIMPDSDTPFIMHPLPRDSRDPATMEISYDVDNDKRAIYFDQVKNGLYVRMALLKLILNPDGLLSKD